VKGKAVEDSQDARQEVLLPAYRVTSNTEIGRWWPDNLRYYRTSLYLYAAYEKYQLNERKRTKIAGRRINHFHRLRWWLRLEVLRTQVNVGYVASGTTCWCLMPSK